MDFKHSDILGYSIVGNYDKILVSLDSSGVLILDGCYHIRATFGTVTILGYHLEEQENVPVFSTRHRAFIPIVPLETRKIEDYDVDALNLCYQLSREQFNQLNFTVGSSAVLIELVPYISNLSRLLSQTTHKSLYMNTPSLLQNDTFKLPTKDHITTPLETEENASILNKNSESIDCNVQETISPTTSQTKTSLSPFNQSEAKLLLTNEAKMINDFKTVLKGVQPILPSMGEVPVINISKDCAETAGELAKNICIFGTDLTIGMRVMIIGEQNVGKTSFLMHLLNTFLTEYKKKRNMKKKNMIEPNPNCETSNKTHQRHEICCLDLDPGQPIQSTPGVMSLKSYSKPLLGPAYAYSAATASKKSEKLKLSNSAKRSAKKMTEEVNVSVKRLQKKNTHKLSHSSIFLAMNYLGSSDFDGKKSERCVKDSEVFLGNISPDGCAIDLVGIAQKLTKTYFEFHKNIPLVVNTMGWIRGKGKIILANLIKLVRPTHIIHLGSPEYQNQSFSCEDLVQYMAHGNYESYNVKINQPFKEAKMKDSYSIQNYGYLCVNSTVKNKASTLLPNPKPVDLRNLLLYSYFCSMWPLQSESFNLSTCKQSVEIDYRQIGVKDMFSDYKSRHPSQNYVNCMFALCSVKESFLLNQGEYSPKLVRILSPETEDIVDLDSLLDFKGWAIVIGVNTNKCTFSLVTPRPDNLKGVNVMVQSKVRIPRDLIKFLR